MSQAETLQGFVAYGAAFSADVAGMAYLWQDYDTNFGSIQNYSPYPDFNGYGRSLQNPQGSFFIGNPFGGSGATGSGTTGASSVPPSADSGGFHTQVTFNNTPQPPTSFPAPGSGAPGTPLKK